MSRLPVPGYQNPSVDGKGRSSAESFRWQKSVSRDLKAMTESQVVGDPSGGNKGEGTINAEELYDNGNRVLTEAGRQTLAAGFDTTPYDHGTKSSGALTIDPLNGQYQIVTCNGAFTLSPASTTKYATVLLHITNGSSAGTVTFTGFNKKYPSGSLNTTNTYKFSVFIYFYGSLGVDYAIQPRQ
jgi:hypothetical protein